MQNHWLILVFVGRTYLNVHFLRLIFRCCFVFFFFIANQERYLCKQCQAVPLLQFLICASMVSYVAFCSVIFFFFFFFFFFVSHLSFFWCLEKAKLDDYAVPWCLHIFLTCLINRLLESYEILYPGGICPCPWAKHMYRIVHSLQCNFLLL